MEDGDGAVENIARVVFSKLLVAPTKTLKMMDGFRDYFGATQRRGFSPQKYKSKSCFLTVGAKNSIHERVCKMFCCGLVSENTHPRVKMHN